MPDIALLTAEKRPINPVDVRRLYDGANWWPGWQPESIGRALAATTAVGAWDGDRLIGFTRALSDGVHRAYVEDVVIDPDYRSRGIGEKLVAALLDAIGDVHIVTLFCLPEREAFYGRNGFRTDRQIVMRRDFAAPEGSV